MQRQPLLTCIFKSTATPGCIRLGKAVAITLLILSNQWIPAVQAQQYIPPYPVQDKPTYMDIVLTERRVCHKCRWTYLDWSHIELENRRGQREVVNPDEIIGIDRHPLIRKIYMHALPASEMAGEIISPEAVMDMPDDLKKRLHAHMTPTMPSAPVNKPAE